ncbi:carboxypeptidase regulatory-like domain-containing protein, partial [Clostridium tarantellae]
MQIKEYKYSQNEFITVNVTQKKQEIKLDVKLEENVNKTSIGVTISGIIKDSKGIPIEGALVKVLDESLKGLANGKTMKNGEYVITNIPISNEYCLEIFSNGKILETTEKFTLMQGESKLINFTLEDDVNIPLGIISGQLIDNSDDRNIISGGIVFLYKNINGNKSLNAITYTDKSGQFVFTKVNSGNYNLVFNALGFIKESTNVTVEDGKISNLTKKMIIDPIASQGIISGIITDESNNPIANADVVLYNASNLNDIKPIAFTITNSLGIYTFINVPKGDYIVKSKQLQSMDLIIPPITVPTGSNPVYKYNAAEGMLSNGALIEDAGGVNVAGWIGGPSDGATTLTVNVAAAGKYNLAVKYIGADANRNLKIDINGTNTGSVYTPTPTNGWSIGDAKTFTVAVNLNSGINTIKFHGDGINYGP